LDTKQLSSENLHPIEYWEDEFDRTVLEAKKQCESDEQRAQLDNVIVELLFNLQEDNEVLDSELGSLIDTIYESVNILHIEEALSRMKASSNKKEVQTLLIDAVTTYSNSKKFILRQVVDFGEFYQAAVFDLFDKYRHEPRALKFFNEILFSEPEFVRSLFSIQDFVRMALFAVEEKGELEDKNLVLEVLYKEIELVRQFLFAKDGPMLVSEMKTASYGSPYRQIFMNVMQSLKSKRRLSPVNKRFIQELQETESRRLQEFIKSPESLLKNFNFYSFINYVGMVSKNLSGNALQEFQLKVLRTFDRPDYIVVLDRMLFALTKVEFLNGKSKDEYRQTFLSIVKLGIKQNILSSKVANLLYKHLHDYKFLAMSKDSFQGGVLTEFDGLSQNEDWIERQSWAKNGFNHVQAFSQIGASLDRVVGNSNSKELVIPTQHLVIIRV
jgi:hypothetical protein